jgi:hypothetical protein
MEMRAEDYICTKGPKWEDILSIAAHRAADQSPLMQQMREIRDRYNGDIVYPWSQAIAGGADMPDLTPHLVGESIDNYGLRAASVMPALHCPAVNPANEGGIASRDWANRRRRALSANLTQNRFPLVARRFFRHLSGYATASLLVEPNFRYGRPQIKVMNPLNTFPDLRAAEDYEDTEDCLYIHGHSASQLRKQFPQVMVENGGPIPASSPSSELWDIIRWVDDECMVFGLAGRRYSWDSDLIEFGRAKEAMELMRIENRMERFPGITMGRVTLDRMGSALTHIMGQVDWAARLQLLDVVATEKAIYPDTYILGDGARTPKLATPGGRWVDGRTGQVNIVQDAQAIGQLRNTPDPAGKQAIDRMERNARVSLGLAAQFGGETTNAMRTGRGMEAVLGASVDPRVHELQAIAEAWLPGFFESVFQCYETYWPETEFSEYSGYPGDKGHVVFTPGKHFKESHKVSVSYPIAGADLQLTNISLSQMLGTESISLHTFRERHPWIDDAEAEGRRVMEEKLELLAFQALTQQAVGGQVPIEQLAMIEEEFKAKGGTDIFSAMRNAIEKLKEKQAAEAPEPQEGQVMAPDQAPGLGGPSGPMGEAPPPANAIGPTEGVEGLRELQNALAAGGRRVNGVQGP